MNFDLFLSTFLKIASAIIEAYLLLVFKYFIRPYANYYKLNTPSPLRSKVLKHFSISLKSLLFLTKLTIKVIIPSCKFL
jgi:hypothetical protein